MQIPFGQLKINEEFTFNGIRYRRIEKQELPRYGFVNAQQHEDEPAAYEGDTGHRFFYGHEPVTPTN